MSQMETGTYDILVVGGGINGCGIARDAAGRGYRVAVVEKGDLASGTSSASTKLIHGGLRYLEHYEFRLVREALVEREILWRNAPHIIWPMRFVLPHHEGLRPAWLLRLGLFLYDHIGGRKALAATRSLDLRHDHAGRLLKPVFTRAFEFSDCWVDDARLVVLNAMDAADRGARVMTQTELVGARRDGGTWLADLRQSDGQYLGLRAKLIVNAAGPWIDKVIARTGAGAGAGKVRLVQGSHIVVRAASAEKRAFFFQNADERIIFAIPYEDEFTLIGTTDRDYSGDRDRVVATAEEIDYLCEAASTYLAKRVAPEDVVWSYSGVRPLYDDGAGKAQEATRDYVVRTEGQGDDARLVNIFGGKITTYRKLAETVLEEVGGHLGERGAPWTATAPLPGGEFAPDGQGAELGRLLNDFSFLGAMHGRRLIRQYGLLAREWLNGANRRADLGRHFGADLYERELRYLFEREWARCGSDVLWRRTKLGLHLDATQQADVDAFMLGLAVDSAGEGALG